MTGGSVFRTVPEDFTAGDLHGEGVNPESPVSQTGFDHLSLRFRKRIGSVRAES